MDLVSWIDALRMATATELTLRNEANRERADGNDNGPMLAAHNAAVARVIDVAKNVIAASQVQE